MLGGLALAAQAPVGGTAFFAGPATHDASLNGEPLLPGTAILPGETVTTSAGGVVVLTSTGGAGGALELTGNASATVGSSPNQLILHQGDALVAGSVSVATPQGEIIAAVNGGTSFVVNAGGGQSSVGVLTGAVNTLGPGGQNARLGAGEAAQVAFGRNGQFQFNRIRMAQVTLPSPAAGMPQTIPASQSR